jgi:osmotically inducible protein OsmC
MRDGAPIANPDGGDCAAELVAAHLSRAGGLDRPMCDMADRQPMRTVLCIGQLQRSDTHAGTNGQCRVGRQPDGGPRPDAAWLGGLEGAYSFASRFKNGHGTNPEELVAAAHAGCYSMALAHTLSEAGHPPERVETTAKVHLEKGNGGFSIPNIDLHITAKVLQIDDEAFQELANEAKENCPISKLLASAEISLEATLVS